MKDKQKTLVEFFFENLESRANYGATLQVASIIAIYRNVFKILPERDLELILANVYRERKQSGWFERFHKSMRNTDFFMTCYRRDESLQLEQTEQKELDALDAELREVHKKMDEYEKVLKIDVPEEDHPDYVQKYAEYSVKYRARFKELFPQEKSSRRFTLKSKLKGEQEKNISGYIDMILWNTIHADANESLYYAMKDTFDDFLEQKQFVRKKKKIVKS
jgi:hypothetical protein